MLQSYALGTQVKGLGKFSLELQVFCEFSGTDCNKFRSISNIGCNHEKIFELFKWLTRIDSKHRKAAMALVEKDRFVLRRDS